MSIGRARATIKLTDAEHGLPFAIMRSETQAALRGDLWSFGNRSRAVSKRYPIVKSADHEPLSKCDRSGTRAAVRFQKSMANASNDAEHEPLKVERRTRAALVIIVISQGPNRGYQRTKTAKGGHGRPSRECRYGKARSPNQQACEGRRNTKSHRISKTFVVCFV
jgi:ribosomal protein L22